MKPSSIKMCSNRIAESVISSPNEKCKMCLTKIELLHFGDDLKNYLVFQSQFQRIYTDDDLHKTINFDICYSAWCKEVQLVKLLSFPPAFENYEKATGALKSKFGTEEMLIEFYVHELLALVKTECNNKNGTSQIFLICMINQNPI